MLERTEQYSEENREKAIKIAHSTYVLLQLEVFNKLTNLSHKELSALIYVKINNNLRFGKKMSEVAVDIITQFVLEKQLVEDTQVKKIIKDSYSLLAERVAQRVSYDPLTKVITIDDEQF